MEKKVREAHVDMGGALLVSQLRNPLHLLLFSLAGS